jgi:hypothetical protein
MACELLVVVDRAADTTKKLVLWWEQGDLSY